MVPTAELPGSGDVFVPCPFVSGPESNRTWDQSFLSNGSAIKWYAGFKGFHQIVLT
jgi:hypothetical protein